MFILVTTTDDEKVIVNSSAIQTVEETTMGSMIFFSRRDCMEVRETFEQLYNKLREKR